MNLDIKSNTKNFLEGVNSNMARKKIIATTDNSKWEAPKKRKPRKPMTEEQKKAAE